MARQIRTIPRVGRRLELTSHLSVVGRGEARARDRSGKEWRRRRSCRILGGKRTGGEECGQGEGAGEAPGGELVHRILTY